MSSNGLNDLKQHLHEFVQARDWDKFHSHSPKNLSMSLSVEVVEIIEHLTNQGCSNVVDAGSTGMPKWLTEVQSKNLPKDKLDEVETELADTFMYHIRLADKLNINLLAAARNKIEVNELKYPIDKAKGNAKKFF